MIEWQLGFMNQEQVQVIKASGEGSSPHCDGGSVLLASADRADWFLPLINGPNPLAKKVDAPSICLK